MFEVEYGLSYVKRIKKKTISENLDLIEHNVNK
jgi:hypothetical protein